MRNFRYLKGTCHYALHIKPFLTLHLMAFTNVDWATDGNDKGSMDSFCVYLGGTLISWASQKQKVVSRASSKSEYNALADGVAELKWLCTLLTELGLFLKQPSIIQCDNLSAQAVASNLVHHTHSKHIDIDVHFIRDQILARDIKIAYVSSQYQIADCLTNALTYTQFSYLMSKLRLCRHLGDVKTNI